MSDECLKNVNRIIDSFPSVSAITLGFSQYYDLQEMLKINKESHPQYFVYRDVKIKKLER